jgi:hypothetical protein
LTRVEGLAADFAMCHHAAMSAKRSDDQQSGKAPRHDEAARRALGVPPQLRQKPLAPKAKERPAQKGRVHRAKSRA